MKKNLLYLVGVALCTVLGAASCQEEPLDPNSVITVSQTEANAFDEWLRVNYMTPYNIDFKYRYEVNESDMNYYTVPADFESSVIMAHLVKYLCIETYDEVAGIEFTRRYFPKQFFLIGEWEYRNNGTFILGTAEGGKKIMLSGINWLKGYMNSADNLNHYYIKTIHHEFTHILNQTVDYPKDFAMVTGDLYVADSWSSEPYSSTYLSRGFITAYAQHSDTEDFAEMLSEYVTHDAQWWNAQIQAAGTAGNSITSKLDIVRNYMEDAFDIDIDELRSTIQRRQDDVVGGLVDLTSTTIK